MSWTNYIDMAYSATRMSPEEEAELEACEECGSTDEDGGHRRYFGRLLCENCQMDIEEAEPDDEPEAGDLVTYDGTHFYIAGEHNAFDVRLKRNAVFIIDDDGDRDEAIKAYMARTKFWPSVWTISDHGNAHRIDLA